MKTRKLTYALIRAPERKVEQMFFADDASREYHGKCNICVHPDGVRGEGHSVVTWTREQVNVSTRASASLPLTAVAAAARQGAHSRSVSPVSSLSLWATTDWCPANSCYPESHCLLWWNNLNSDKVNSNIPRLVPSAFL